MRARTDLSDMTQYAAAAQKRTHVAALLILGLMPLTILAVTFLLGSNLYMVGSLLIIVYTMVPFFMVFERRRPKAREIVLIAMMSALTVVIHLFFHLTIPLQAGTAMVIISGISLGPEAGFLVGALARFVCNFYMGQGPWKPWQMFCWGMLGFLAGLAFNKIDYAQVKNRTFRDSLASPEFSGGHGDRCSACCSQRLWPTSVISSYLAKTRPSLVGVCMCSALLDFWQGSFCSADASL